MNVGCWAVSLPGQPPSVNHTYAIARKRAVDRNGQPVFGDDGQQRTYTSLIKKATVKKYQQDIALILRAAKPLGFQPRDKIYVVYDFYLGRDIDIDNTYKAIHDALADVLGVNDRVFLPIARHKETKVSNPFIRLSLFDADQYQIEIKAR